MQLAKMHSGLRRKIEVKNYATRIPFITPSIAFITSGPRNWPELLKEMTQWLDKQGKTCPPACVTILYVLASKVHASTIDTTSASRFQMIPFVG